jgi:DNA-directed RNA polymerase subunit RPC12/RpoP
MPDYIPLKCGKCGSPHFEVPENPQPDDAVRCRYCGGHVQIFLLDGFDTVPYPVRAVNLSPGKAASPTELAKTVARGGNGGARTGYPAE